MHHRYDQYVDHVGLHLHASDEPYHSANPDGKEMIVCETWAMAIYVRIMSIFEINNQNIRAFAF